MEIRIYNNTLLLQGVVENQTSFLWTRRYDTVGEFEIHVPITDYTVKLFKRGNLVTYSGAGEAGVIEDLQYSEDSDLNEITAKGRFLPCYMDYRVITGTYNFTGKTEVAMRNIYSRVAAIPLVQLGTLKNYTETVDFQSTYKNLLSYEEKLASSAGYGFRFIPDFTAKTITFDIYKGVNRSKSQTDRAYVEFSENFDNINSAVYYENDQLLKNVAYIGGEGEGSQRTFVTIGDTSLTGLNRREVFIDARDIQSEDLTTAEYKAALRERGKERLKEWVLAQTFECSTMASTNFVYKKDYDVGDIVTIKKYKWGVSADLRLSEITEVYEQGTMTVIPVFGDPIPTKINWEDDD